MKMAKYLALFTFILAIAFGVFKGTQWWYERTAEIHAKEQSVVLLEKIKSVTKLVTVEGFFSEMYDYEDYWGYDVGLFRKKALVRIKAKVSVGYDLTQMEVEAIAEERKVIISQLPDPEIISIDHDLDYYDISEGTFNQFSPDDYNKINASAKDKVREQANASDLFLKAEEQSNQMLDIIQFMVEGAGWELEYKPQPVDEIKN